jgi:hypothetical protein
MEHRRPARGRDRDLRLDVGRRRSAGRVHVGPAEELTGRELERGIEVFGRLSETDVGRRWGLDEVQPPSLFRLYRVAVSEHYVLIAGRDPELGTGVDRREPVTPA